MGCGLCAQICPEGAISILGGQAEINRGLCNSCRLCLVECPQGAIVDKVYVSAEDLKATVVDLRQQADNILKMVDRLKSRSAS